MTMESKIKLLSKLIRKAADEIDEGNIAVVVAWAHRFEEEGIEPGMHTGRNKEMEGDTPKSTLLTLEWFAGALLDIHIKNAYFAVNSWIHMASTVLPKEEEIEG